jgi:hypothetical protein
MFEENSLQRGKRERKGLLERSVKRRVGELRDTVWHFHLAAEDRMKMYLAAVFIVNKRYLGSTGEVVRSLPRQIAVVRAEQSGSILKGHSAGLFHDVPPGPLLCLPLGRWR